MDRSSETLGKGLLNMNGSDLQWAAASSRYINVKHTRINLLVKGALPLLSVGKKPCGTQKGMHSGRTSLTLLLLYRGMN